MLGTQGILSVLIALLPMNSNIFIVMKVADSNWSDGVIAPKISPSGGTGASKWPILGR